MRTPLYQRVYSVFGFSVLIGTLIMVPFIALQLPDSFTWRDMVHRYWPRVLMSIVYTFVLSEGNSYLDNRLDHLVRWIDRPVKRLVISIVAMFVYSTIAILLIQWIMGQLVWEAHCDCVLTWRDYYLPNLYFPLGITVLITTVLNSRKFLLEWRRSAIEAERLQREQLASQYQSLKDQVNPHFLFNSLNALTYLVYENQEQAVVFIQKLSIVYRYVLDTRDQEVVTLGEELAFVQAYVFLQKIRFKEALQVQIQVPNTPGYKIPPLALQMLLENAVKHNEISARRPLRIDITTEDDTWLVVRNSIYLKDIREPSSGVGLSNIRSRYAYLSQQGIVVTSDEQHFTVKLPLLRVKSTIPTPKVSLASPPPS